MINLDTPIGYRFSTDPDVMGYNGRAAQEAAMADLQNSMPCVIKTWPSMLERENQIWGLLGWHEGSYGDGIVVYHERCVQDGEVWRKLTQSETDHLTVLANSKKGGAKCSGRT